MIHVNLHFIYIISHVLSFIKEWEFMQKSGKSQTREMSKEREKMENPVRPKILEFMQQNLNAGKRDVTRTLSVVL